MDSSVENPSASALEAEFETWKKMYSHDYYQSKIGRETSRDFTRKIKEARSAEKKAKKNVVEVLGPDGDYIHRFQLNGNQTRISATKTGRVFSIYFLSAGLTINTLVDTVSDEKNAIDIACAFLQELA